MKHERRVHALLVGIDQYLAAEPPRRPVVNPLWGSVGDVQDFRRYLRDGLELAEDEVVELTATRSDTGEPPEPRERWPTYENMTEALLQLEKRAEPGDQVLFYYSGHGHRVPTTLPDLKGKTGLDEVLVPVDVHRAGARYLRDHEIGAWLLRLERRGIFATLIFDCCHAGGLSRAAEESGAPLVRSALAPDVEVRPAESALATEKERKAAWLWNGGLDARAGLRKTEDGEAPGAVENLVVLAACQSNQEALAVTVEKLGYRGVFTRALLGLLTAGGRDLTYRHLVDGAVCRVSGKWPTQTPRVEGAADRLVFGKGTLPSVDGVSVLAVEQDAEGRTWLVLRAGVAQGVQPGACLAPLARKRSVGAPEVDLQVEVREVGATESRARVSGMSAGTPLPKVGDVLRLVDPGLDSLRHRVRTSAPEPDSPGARDPLERFERALVEAGGFLELGKDDETPDHWLTVRDGVFRICDPQGDPIPFQGSGPRPEDEAAVAMLLDRFVQLTRYANTRALRNTAAIDLLAPQVEVEAAIWPRGFDPNNLGEPRPVDITGGRLAVEAGDGLRLRVRSKCSEPLHLTVLDLRCNWEVFQLLPRVGAGDSVVMEPHEDREVRVKTWVPDGVDDCLDVFKLFLTMEEVPFRWLLQPALGVVGRSGAEDVPAKVLRGPANALEALLASVAVNRPVTRGLSLFGEEESLEIRRWTVRDLHLEIRRAGS